jgi:hypothetical protein
LNADPDPATQINADPCGSGYGSETLIFIGTEQLWLNPLLTTCIFSCGHPPPFKANSIETQFFGYWKAKQAHQEINIPKFHVLKSWIFSLESLRLTTVLRSPSKMARQCCVQ